MAVEKGRETGADGRHATTVGHDESCPYNGKGSGAEEDGFALEHFYGDEEGGGGVDAVGSED